MPEPKPLEIICAIGQKNPYFDVFHGGEKFESELSNLIGGSYTNSSKLDLCMTHGGKNEKE